MTTSVFACPDARGSQWQLGVLPAPDARVTLIGWRQTSASADAGVPSQVAAILAAAMCAIGRVTFLSSAVSNHESITWVDRGEDSVIRLPGPGVVGSVRVTVTGTPTSLGVVSTRRPETAIQMFDDAQYPWWMQAQVALLSSARSQLPTIDREVVLALLENDWRTALPRLSDQAHTIVRPGVDGDLAAAIALNPSAESPFVASLERECRSAAVQWSMLNEDEFARQFSV